jgi:hypothetical protein
MKASTRGGKWKGQPELIGLADLSEVAEGMEAADQLVEHLASCPGWQDPATQSSLEAVLGQFPAIASSLLSAIRSAR